MANVTIDQKIVNKRINHEKDFGETFKLRITGKYVCISRHVVSGFRGLSSTSGRGEINSLSPSSSARMRRYLRECCAEYKVFITLTYPVGYGKDGERAKRDLKVFMQRYERRANRIDGKPFSAFWFMEFQKSGTIHFHIFGTHYFDYECLGRDWYEVVGSEDEYHLHAGTSVEKIRAGRSGCISYAAKYAAKAEQKITPDDLTWTGRFWGVFGLRKCVSASVIFHAKDGLNPANQAIFDFFRTDMAKAEKEKRCYRLRKVQFARVYVVRDARLLQKIMVLCLRTIYERGYELERRYAGVD